MIDAIGTGFGVVMYWCYALAHNYGLAIILFTAVTKIVLFPLSILQQKNSIKMVKLQPEINQLKAQYINDPGKAGEAQYDLYKRENYKPLLGLVPTLIQIPIILGIINVVYKPLTHLIRLGSDAINALQACTLSYLGVEKLGLAWQIKTIELLGDAGFTQYISAQGLDARTLVQQVTQFQSRFLGLNLFEVPTLHNGLLAIPVAAVLSTLALCLLQNRANVLQREQQGFGRWGTTVLMVALALYFSFAVPAAAGLYWAVGNIAAILLMYLVNLLIDPRKHIDYDALEKSKAVLARANRTKKSKKELTQERSRVKADYKRFFDKDAPHKELVVYSVQSGFYRYFKDVLEYILGNSNIVIHYVTSDPKDVVFGMDDPRLVPYYIEGNELIYFFMKLDTDVMVMTMPEIEKYHYKRSLVRKDIDYVYLFHALVSTHMIYRQGAFDHYDTILCCGPHHIQEIRETEQAYGLPKKRLIEFGYPLLDDLRERYRHIEKQSDRFQILIAPSHHDGNILDSCIDEVLARILDKGYYVIIRPHPQYVKRNTDRIAALQEKFGNREDVKLETDFSTNDSLYTSDVMITDWSGISLEYSFVTRKPCLFINTKMKVLNPEYQKISAIPILIALRDKIGVSVDLDALDQLSVAIEGMRTKAILTEDEIEKIAQETVFHLDSCGVIGARYIIDEICARRGDVQRSSPKQDIV